MASEKGHLGVVQALLDAGADKEVKDRVGGGIGSDHSLFQDVNPQYDGGICSPARMCMKYHMMLYHIGHSGRSGVGGRDMRAEGDSGDQSLRSGRSG